MGSATGDPSAAIGERTQMIKAAIVGLGWWGGIIHRNLPPAKSSGPCSASSRPTRRAR